MTLAGRRPTYAMSDDELVAEARAIERIEDRAALTDPASTMRRLLPATYRRRPHVRVISTALTRLVDPDPARRVDRILIRVPPQTGKTTTAVVGGSFWWLARNPAARVAIGSYNDNLATDRGRDIKALVAEHGHRYGLKLSAGATRVDDWRLTAGGGVKSVGIGGGITGFPADFAIIDDPHKSREEADSLRMRDRAYRWLSGDIISRLSPGAAVLLVMTPWHPDDLSARVIRDHGRTDEGGRWLVVDMPALCTDPARDPLGRRYGEPLPHPKIAVHDVAAALRHWEDKRSSSTVQDWMALYQLDAQPAEGALLTRELLRERRAYATCAVTPVKKAAVAVDPSGGGRDVAGIIGGHLAADNRLYITHDRSGIMASDQWARAACQLALDIDADRIIVEVNYGGDMATLSVRTAWAALRAEDLQARGGDVDAPEYRESPWYGRMCPRIVAVRARKAKLLRAEPIAQQWQEDRIRTGAYLPEMEEEWATWQPDHHDSPGRIDASVYLAYALLPPPSAGDGRSSGPPTGPMPASSATPLDRPGPGGGGFTSGAFGAGGGFSSSTGPLG